LEQTELSSRELAARFTDTLEIALTASGCGQVHVRHRPGLLSVTGSSYISGDLAEWLDAKNMTHVRGTPYHPQIQSKIERRRQTLKNRILMENYYLPGDLEAQIGHFTKNYNHYQYHKSLQNLILADVYFGRSRARAQPGQLPWRVVRGIS
jgi:putative transposase